MVQATRRRLVSMAALAPFLAGAAPPVSGVEAAGLLVLMHASGKVERYDPATGAHLGTFSTGLAAPNVLLPGPDGLLDVSTGDPGGWDRPGGITGNNVISDPVSVNMDRNFQWLAGMGDEGIISRDCCFLQTAILTDDPARELFEEARAERP